MGTKKPILKFLSSTPVSFLYWLKSSNLTLVPPLDKDWESLDIVLSKINEGET